MFGFFKRKKKTYDDFHTRVNILQNGDGEINVNGTKYKGNSVSIVNNAIFIDGVLQKPSSLGRKS